MLAAVARGTYLLVVGVMIVAWALSFGHTEAQTTQPEQPAQEWTIFT